MNCPDCGKQAYVGLNVVECSNTDCRHYVGPPVEPELDWGPGCLNSVIEQYVGHAGHWKPRT